MELKDFDVVESYIKDGQDYVLERDYAKLRKFAKKQDEHIKCLQEELENAKSDISDGYLDAFKEIGDLVNIEMSELTTVQEFIAVVKDVVRDNAKIASFRTHTESARAFQEQNERLTETIKQIDEVLEQCFGVRHTDFKNDVEMKDALQGHVKIKLPQEPIGVAEYLIAATRYVKATSLHNLCQTLAGEEQSEVAVEDMYSCSDLRQIAEHLLVYCNAHKEEE